MALKRPPAVETVDPVEPVVHAPRAVTAATATVVLGKSSAWATWKFGNNEFQKEAWRLYDIVGELRFLAAWIGDSISQCRLYVTKIDKGEETGEVEDQRIAELASMPLGTGSQRDDNLRLLGIDLAVAGEAWIVGENAATPNPEGWFVLSGDQVKREGGIVTVRRPLQMGGEILRLTDGRDLLIRVWRPHPNDIYQSDSPTRSAIPPLREIELLTKREFAELESRLTGPGLMPMPEGFDFPHGEGEPEGVQGFMGQIQNVAAQNIQDQSSAAALVPIMFTVPDHMMENVDKIKPINFWSPLSDNILPMKQAAISRVAASFEIPSSLLGDGLGTANHWSAWAISEEGIKRIKPYLSCIADTLTRGFLIPLLEREGVADADRYAYTFDVSPLAVRPNRMDEAIQLWDRGLIAGTETVKSGAFTVEQMPQGQERVIELVYKAVAQAPTLITEPVIQQLLGLSSGPVPVSGGDEEQPAVEELPDVDRPADSMPDTLDDGPDDSPSAPGTSTMNPLHMAAKATVLRALELAGGRLVKVGDRKGHLAGVPHHELHTRVGPLLNHRIDPLLRGAWVHVETLAQDLGVPGSQLQYQLSTYCRDLLLTGTPHSDKRLAAWLKDVS
jgi:hypothetical protein